MVLIFVFALTTQISAQPPPNEGMKLWLAADEGTVPSFDGSIGFWDDQGPGPVFHNAVQVLGAPRLEDFEFPNGPHEVVSFYGAEGFRLENEDDLFLPNLSIYAVIVPPFAGGQTIVGNYKDATGYVLGLSDFFPGVIKWWTSSSVAPGYNVLSAGRNNVTADVPIVLTATVDTPEVPEGDPVKSEKRTYINGNLLGEVTIDGESATYQEPPTHNLTIGYLLTAPNVSPGQFFTGKIAEILIYDSVSEEQQATVENYLTQKYFVEGSGPPEITEQPQSRDVSEGGSVEFSVTVAGTGPFNYEWRENGVAIPGAVDSSYTVDFVRRTQQGTEFSVRVTNVFGEQTSESAVLTVIDIDNDVPVLVSVERSLGDETIVYVNFDEPVTEPTAVDVGNYSVDSGVTVTGAEIAAASPSAVILTTSAIPSGTILTVSGIEDRFGNVITVTSTVPVEVPLVVPPQDDLKLWLSADTGVALARDVSPEVVEVGGWLDQAKNGGIKHDSIQTIGRPSLTGVDLLGGTFPAIHFENTEENKTGFVLDNREDMYLDELSVYALIVPRAGSAQTIIGNYRDATGWVLGQSDALAGTVKWFSSGTFGFDSLEGDSENLFTGVPAIVSAMSMADGRKSLFVDGFAVAENVLAGTPAYLEPPDLQLTVGVLEPGSRQFYTGEILEILVYSSVSDGQRVAVDNYFRQKYFTVGAGAPTIVTHPRSQSVAELDVVTFCVVVAGAPPFSYEWRQDGNLIPDATGACYTIGAVLGEGDGTEFTVTVTSDLGSVTSNPADLTVTDIDSSPPEIAVTKLGLAADTLVFVEFDEIVTDTSASIAGNYSINNDVIVHGVQIFPSGNTVLLNTSPVPAGSTLTVSGVEDVVGNVANTSSVIQVTSGGPPRQNLRLCLSAGIGVAARPDGVVSGWFDQAVSGGVSHHSTEVLGLPTLATFDFRRGSLPVVRLPGGAGFRLDNEEDLFLESISVYAVVVPTIGSAQVIVGNYSDATATGYVLGQSDNLIGEIKWFTAHPVDSMESGVADLSTGVATTLTGTIDGGIKSLYQDGLAIAENVDVLDGEAGPTPTYPDPPQDPPSLANLDHALSIGFLDVRSAGGSSQFFTGDIAEILIYDSASEQQRDAVWSYFQGKYFEDLPPSELFRRGDCDQSGTVDFNDAIFHLKFLFLGENEDEVNSCRDACDSDDSGADDFTDDINTLRFLFLGQGEIPPPGILADESHPCGVDLTQDDETTCVTYEAPCP